MTNLTPLKCKKAYFQKDKLLLVHEHGVYNVDDCSRLKDIYSARVYKNSSYYRIELIQDVRGLGVIVLVDAESVIYPPDGLELEYKLKRHK